MMTAQCKWTGSLVVRPVSCHRSVGSSCVSRSSGIAALAVAESGERRDGGGLDDAADGSAGESTS